MLKRPWNLHEKELMLFLPVLIISFLFGLICYINMPRSFNISDEKIGVFNSSAIGTYGYVVDGNHYTPDMGDPQIYIDLGGNDYNFSYISIELSSIADSSIPVQVYYPYEDAGLSEANSVKGSIRAKDTGIVFEIPLYNYSYIRLDIDGSVYIENVYISDKAETTGIVTYDFVFVLIAFNILAFISIVLMSRFGLIFKIKSNIVTAIKSFDKKRFVKTAIVLTCAILLAFLAEILISKKIYESYFIWQRFAFYITIILSVLWICLMRQKPELLFLCLSLTTGIMIAVTVPISLVSWDEESHYPISVGQASFFESYYTNADSDIRSINIENYFNKGLREEELRNKNDVLNTIISGVTNKDIGRIYNFIGHTPAGMGVFIGRGLGLSWSSTFILGRIFNVIAYSFIIYFALRKLKSGKYILAVIALFPTCLYLASNYSYDYWVTAWLALGMAYFLSEIQQPDKLISAKDALIMIGAFVIGLGPKAIYFPIMLVLFFVSKNKFLSISVYKKYIIASVLSMLFVIVSFAIPFIVSDGGGAGDSRGGEGINASEQTKYILSNPFQYTGTLINFLKTYLSFETTRDYTVFWAYLGHTGNHVLLLMTLVFVVFTDKNQYDVFSSGIALKAKIYAIYLITMCLVATALYIPFTPVGVDYIAGCQSRYILPMLFPLLAVVGSGRIKNMMNKSVYTVLVFSVCSYILLSGMWDLCISKYN